MGTDQPVKVLAILRSIGEEGVRLLISRVCSFPLAPETFSCEDARTAQFAPSILILLLRPTLFMHPGQEAAYLEVQQLVLSHVSMIEALIDSNLSILLHHWEALRKLPDLDLHESFLATSTAVVWYLNLMEYLTGAEETGLIPQGVLTLQTKYFKKMNAFYDDYVQANVEEMRGQIPAGLAAFSPLPNLMGFESDTFIESLIETFSQGTLNSDMAPTSIFTVLGGVCCLSMMLARSLKKEATSEARQNSAQKWLKSMRYQMKHIVFACQINRQEKGEEEESVGLSLAAAGMKIVDMSEALVEMTGWSADQKKAFTVEIQGTVPRLWFYATRSCAMFVAKGSLQDERYQWDLIHHVAIAAKEHAGRLPTADAQYIDGVFEGRMCSCCLKMHSSKKSLKRCGGCRAVAYCNRECQATHWKVHKPQCIKPKQ